ncbi:transcription termination/antitermination protein NusA [Apibacter muscae]|uniref:Transcription termination/antitermination protein NusA n=1 Tax=Apibacter muscae TaxID=2509004 RepID=A0A563DI75_9FLAO|nr:transcription termination factor NusA [Apibacter muscae]TWP24784.1 transcription termination/antitermination protein NusA [Apibacter muscae]TWP29837.1 transcription termination/antitermination protein NusA [Apibacter muscae]TWP30985.1 transcription termination/antitermination protein NusA [Apibacter muscae]
MDSIELIESFGDFKDEKNIDRITLMAIVEESMKTVLRKRYGSDEHFDVIVNPDKGDLEIYLNRKIVEDEMSEDDLLEIEISEVRKIDPSFEVGEEYTQKIELNELGRRNILAFKQVLNTKIAEYDNSNLYEKFRSIEGEIVSGEVHHIRHRQVILMDEDQNDMILPKENQIPSDFFRKGETVRAVVQEVGLKGGKPQIVLSRTSPKFLEKLFEFEIPEIYDGLITIKKTVRIPGEKAKIAVESYDDRIDPVGACVGMKGSRIHSVVRELKNENIDVINYTTNQQLFIQRALSPAKISSMDIDEENKNVVVYLRSEEVSKAIGKGGQNIKLASWLTGYEIDVRRDEPEEDIELVEFSDEIDSWVIDELRKIGLDTARSVLEKDLEDLLKITDLEEETILDVVRILKEEFAK